MTTMKAGDLEPDLIIDISDPTEAADLTGVTSWRLIGKIKGQSTLLLDEVPAVVVDPADKWKAAVTHQWAAGETDTEGLVELEVEATWPGGRKQTFPSFGYAYLRIGADLG